jgi:hypothetical protein
MVGAYYTMSTTEEDDTELEYPLWEAFRRSYTLEYRMAFWASPLA